MSPDSPIAAAFRPSPNHGERAGVNRPDLIILHYTGMVSAEAALDWLCAPASQVSCHYFIDEAGHCLQLVPEGRRAWHAGRAHWAGIDDINSHSIGIEIANPGHAFDANGRPLPHAYPDFGVAQIATVIALLTDLVRRLDIDPAHILAHSDVAPGRKIDPGERFPWVRLAEAGLGLWPSARVREPASDAPPSCFDDRAGDHSGAQGASIRALQTMFARFGYGLELTGVCDQHTIDVVTAFQRHWRQERVDGVADGGTVAVLMDLLRSEPGNPA